MGFQYIELYICIYKIFQDNTTTSIGFWDFFLNIQI